MSDKDELSGRTDDVESRALNRRALVTGAAWSVPAIALAVSAPAAAASPVPAACHSCDGACGGWCVQACLDKYCRIASVAFWVGSPSGLAGLYAYSMPGSDTYQVSLYTVRYEWPFRISWSGIPAGFRITEEALSGGRYAYTLSSTSPIGARSANYGSSLRYGDRNAAIPGFKVSGTPINSPKVTASGITITRSSNVSLYYPSLGSRCVASLSKPYTKKESSTFRLLSSLGAKTRSLATEPIPEDTLSFEADETFEEIIS